MLVATETGKIYSFGFYYRGEVALPPQLSWEKEQIEPVDPVSHSDLGADFITLPPLFKVEQLYEWNINIRWKEKAGSSLL